jgi:hypothetical protein
MRVGQYDIKLDDVGFMVVEGTYSDTGRTPLLEKNIMETAEGSLDFSIGWPYFQRSWILGEQQEYTHEYDELKTSAPRRYFEGHGVNNEKHGKLSLLPALTRTLTATDVSGNFGTCPICTNKTGSTVYAFPAGQTKMWKYAAGSWTSESITGVVAPVLDCINAGDELYIVDSNNSGSRVLKRSSGGTWSRVTVQTSTTKFGYDDIATDYVEVNIDKKYTTKWDCPFNGTLTKLSVYLDGKGSGSGNQVLKAIVYSASGSAPNELVTSAVSSEVTVTDGQSEGWVDFTFTTPPTVTTTEYFIGIIAGGNTNTTRLYYLQTGAGVSAVASDTYSDGPSASFGTATISTDFFCVYATLSYVPAGWATTAYDTATAVAWSNGELYILTPTALYAHTAGEYGSEWTGGSIMCSHSGCIFFSDGSNRVYMYQGQGTRLILEDLPDGFQVQCLFSKQARMWVCGQLANGDAAIYWYSRSMWGIVGQLSRGSSTSRSITAGAATTEHVLFADSKYGGIVRHYVSEGGLSHYLAFGSEMTIPYKGLTTGAGKTVIVLYNNGANDGIYVDSANTYVASGWIEGSNSDVQMPGHTKLWHSITVECLPLKAGEKIQVYASVDGGTTFTHYGDIDGIGVTRGEFRIEATSVICKYKLVLYAGTNATTTPYVISVCLRGSPAVRYGRKWEFGIKGYIEVEDHTGRSSANMKEKIDELLQKIDTATPMNFIDIYGDQYRVVARPYKRTPFRATKENPRQFGAVVTIMLEETP